MMDVGRSYISLEELKREIDAMSLFKLNVFHWHLTENQAWRLESRLFPMLNDSINTTRQPVAATTPSTKPGSSWHTAAKEASCSCPR